MPTAESSAPAASEHPYKMKDLCDLTDLSRQTIHFYIQRGLLPQGHKTGRNMAYYSEVHLERIRLIKKLQHERFLPLKAIKALLDERESHFSAGQRAFLLDVKQHLGQSLAEGSDGAGEVALVGPQLERLEVSREDFDRMVELELIGKNVDADGHEVIAQDDLWMLESWAEVQRLGFGRELGFSVDDVLVFDEVVTQLFMREAQLIATRLPEIDPERAAAMVEKALPIVHSFLTGLHRAKIRNFLASIG